MKYWEYLFLITIPNIPNIQWSYVKLSDFFVLFVFSSTWCLFSPFFPFKFLPSKTTGCCSGLNSNLSKALLIWKSLLFHLELNGLWFNSNSLGPIRCEIFFAGGSGRQLPHLLEFLLTGLFSLFIYLFFLLFWVMAKNSIALSLLAINLNWVKIDKTK